MTLPFKQKDIYLGLAEISGLLRIVENALEIEYKVKDTTFGILDSSVKTCHIPLRIIDSIQVEKKWFSTKFEITFNRIPDLDNPFKLEGNSLTFTVKKSDLDKANAFRSGIMFRVLDHQMDETDKEENKKYNPPKEKQKTQHRPTRRSNNSSGGLENMLREE